MATEKKSLKDIKNVDEFDLNSVELMRGETPEDIKLKCYNLCRDYLAGVWLKAGIDEIQVKRLSGGLTNQLYYCAITKPHQPINVGPQEVVVRLYGEKHWNNLDYGQNGRLTDVVVGLLVSEHKLGPKIYGLFEGGQIQRYYKHRQFQIDEQNDPKLVDELSRKLAKIHAMDVPLKKDANWILGTLDVFYETAYRNFPIDDLIEECNCQTLKKYDVKQEIEWIKNLIVETDSPIVFNHNDFRGSNVMVNESESKDTDENEGKLILCDFEYSSYGYRGIDFGTIFAEWGRSIFDCKTLHEFPEDSVIKPFINSYIDELIKIHGKQYSADKKNSVEQILKEVKVFALVANILLVLICYKNDHSVGGLPFDKKMSMVSKIA